MDQAEKLRQIIAAQSRKQSSPDARMIAVTSGKGGVGKTNFTINIALALRALGKEVTIIDADLGLANVDVLLGMISKYSFLDVLSGSVEAKDLVAEGPNGVKIVSGGSGLTDLVNIEDLSLERLIYALSYFNSISDFILIDTGAGISKSVMSFLDAASEIIVILNPDPTSITDAYALIKNISNIEEKQVKLVINRVESAAEGKEAFAKISNTVERFLDIRIENLGFIFEDYHLGKAVKQQQPVITAYPRSLSSRAIEEIARNLVDDRSAADASEEKEESRGLFGFLKRLARL